MIISSVLKVVGGKLYSLASKSEAHPKSANFASIATGIFGLLGFSEDSRTSLADTLISIAEILKSL